ncbi:FAD binding domain-containing protein [Aquincola tertiaricarbonis]|uniref:FAD binding domain-containing protein n=1 Tax=Aquincola tertiaricarbonis TaxID=391953 RepID=UPI000614B6DB|nr:xanthine dehydrogenase family protein subunit M [Aquincola tertiaricarbonis]
MREFGYAAPADVPAVLSRKAATPAARYYGGGTTLFDLMKLGVEGPVSVIDVTRCDALQTLEAGRSEWRLGAAMTMADVAADAALQREFPALAESLWKAASPQIRNMATLGGNLLQRTRCAYFRGTPAYACNKREPGSGCSALEGVNRGHAVLGGSEHCVATYPGDLAVALVAFDAVLELRSPRGPRTLAVIDLHREPGSTPHLETTLADDELIVAIRVPRAPATRASVYHKVRDRESYAFALASAAVGLQMDGGRVVDVRIGLGGVATRPWRARAAERQLLGQPLTRESARQAAESAFAEARPLYHNRFKVALGIDVLTDALMQSKARL